MSAKGSVPAGKTRALSSSAAVAPIARRSNGQHTVVADLRAPSQLDVGRTCNSSRDTFRLIIIARNERAWLSCVPRCRPVIERRVGPLLPRFRRRFAFEPPWQPYIFAGNRGGGI